LKLGKVDGGSKAIWNAMELKKGTRFSLGNHGTLKVLTAANRTRPTIVEWNDVKSDTLQEVKNVGINEKLLGKNMERHHREYIRGSWEPRPLPILVLSKSTR
jgi:hypothetical protein